MARGGIVGPAPKTAGPQRNVEPNRPIFDNNGAPSSQQASEIQGEDEYDDEYDDEYYDTEDDAL